VAWGVVAVLLGVLWVRSYTWIETISGRGRNAISVSTFSGSVFINEGYILTIDDPAIGAALGTIYHTRKPLAGGRDFISSQPDIGYKPRGIGTKFPIWLFVAAVVVIAAVPWFPWLTRFNLRTLFIATTLVAVVLGLIVYVVRSR